MESRIRRDPRNRSADVTRTEDDHSRHAGYPFYENRVLLIHQHTTRPSFGGPGQCHHALAGSHHHTTPVDQRHFLGPTVPFQSGENRHR